ncbi:amidohydrolase [Pseudoalteromonas sp. T1lg88]|uniref:amidohydrolase n=1 Tax=Pseudoalteromonas sp. T1lg88 TaxID=2077104 RepID=UPI000CF60034|nr:amidohydrolase [Pseudoalteromonas sp. T1lg88]
MNLSVALVQQDIRWLDVDTNLTQLSTRLESIGDVDLIILAETFATGFAVADSQVHESAEQILIWLKEQAQRHRSVMCASVIVAEQGQKFNRLYWVSPDGVVQHYDKRHLFCLGQEGKYLNPGKQRVIFTLKGLRILPQVCYDLRFPVFARNRNDYEVMINIANWPAARRSAWDTLLRARAIENQCYVLAVNRIGDDGHGIAHNGGTAVYDFSGEPLAQTADDQPQVLTITLDKDALEEYRQAFPAWQDADAFDLR